MPEMPYGDPLPPDILNTIKQMRRELDDLWKSLGQNRDGDAVEYVDIPFTLSGELSVSVSPGWTPLDDDLVLYEIDCTLTTAGTTDTVATCYLNGVSIGDITIPAGQNFAVKADVYQVYQAHQDMLSFGCSTVGGGAKDLVCVARLSTVLNDDLDP